MSNLEDSESAHEAIPTARPRERVFLDEFISKVIHLMRVDDFHCVMAHDLPAEERVTFSLSGYNPTDESEYDFEGKGPTIGHALRDILDQVAVVFGLEKEAL
ncbi:MAG: hypothetical protein EBZ48_02790 [Proteobacteria bacterium]|nr:hypothetical protein [Pseudomonadota bacterium]